MAQWYCRVGGQQYGPITEEALRQWLREGRVGSSDLVWSEGMAQWLPASQVSGLTVGAAVPPGPPFQAVRPHRGAMVLIFGILGLVCCLLFGIAAWVMGSKDLAELQAGRMDISGQGITRAGKICGIISVILAIVGIIVQIILVAVGYSPLFFQSRYWN